MKLKKVLPYILLATCFSIGTPANADEYYEDLAESDGSWYYVSTDYDPGIALHPIPEKNSETLIRIPYLQTFFVDDVDGKYGYTYYEGYEGWINIAEHAKPLADPDELDDCFYEGEWYQISTKYDPGIALHPLPKKDSATLIRVPYGTEIYVEYRSGNYGYINYDGYQGWINVGEHAELIDYGSDEYSYTYGDSLSYTADEASMALREYCIRYNGGGNPDLTTYISDEYQDDNVYVLWYRWYTGFTGKYEADLVTGDMYESGPYNGREPDSTLPFSTEYIGNIEDYLY